MGEKAQAAFLYKKFKCIHWKISLKWSASYFKLESCESGLLYDSA